MRRIGTIFSLSAAVLLLWVGLALAATEVICIVDTDATQNPDYTSLAAAIAGERGASPKCVTSADLVANDEQLTIECRASSGAADTTAVTISGFTISADCYIKIYVPPAHRHQGVWSDQKYRLVTDGSPITMSQRHFIIDGLQLYCNNSSSGYRYNITLNAGSGSVATMVVKNVISKIVNAGANTRRHVLLSSTGYTGSTLGIINSIFYCTGDANGVGLNHNEDADIAVSVFNCTFYKLATGLNIGATHPCKAVNVAAIGCTDGFANAGTWTAGTDYNLSDITDDAPGANSVDTAQLATALFKDPASFDFSIKDASSNLYNAGTDLSAYMEAVDIIGTERPQGSAWDIGAFEFGGSKWNGITPAKWNGIDWSNLKWNGM